MRLFLHACVFAVATGSALAQSVSDATNIDTRWNRSWPAGPFSQVSTSWGILQTSVPICGVEGPGGTSIGASIYHRSNQDAGSQYGIHDGGAGRGWYLSLSQTCQSGNGGVTWFQGGNNTAALADFAWFDKNGNLRIAEVKTGPRASYTPNQRQILPNLLEANGGQRAIIRSAKIPGKYGKAINVILDRITRVRM